MYRKGIKGKLDAIFSLFIRVRDKWTCQRCGKKLKKKSRGYHCAHFKRRGIQSTTWDPKNASGLCYGCHDYLDHHYQKKVDWYIEKYGKRQYNEVIKRSNQIRKYKEWEIINLIKLYQKGVEDMGYES